ncbi:YbhB/YbcL family Raf kinase inhibitor-like protein [Nitrincola sp. MINF-07-Sa-05]|uniref:YbhB/YbcL family Raf kinase inhibitor-like protein n=1 Tax=Nitrincola salilacus TaxID=3400273 RepID=UPI0039183FC7
MKLVSNSISPDQPIPEQYAFARIAPENHITLSDNINPHLAWSDAPAGTQSFVLICHDPDVPSKGDDVNQEGRTVPDTLPRVDFYHWLLLDIPASVTEIAEGSHCRGVTPNGKPGPAGPYNMRHGINDYTAWFAGDENMKGDYFGYDGPCPPWNDERLHRYIFTLYALDVTTLQVQGDLTGGNVVAALDGHVLANASFTSTYTLNPAL